MNPNSISFPGNAGLARLYKVQNEIIASFRDSPLSGYILTIVIVAFFALLRDSMTPYIGMGTTYITFFAGVILVATLLGFWPGVVATCSSALVMVYCFLPSNGIFLFRNIDGMLGLCVFLISGYFICVVADLYHRTRANIVRAEQELALRQSEDRLRFHTENSPLAVIEWDANFIITRWTGMAERIFGWSAEEVQGKPLEQLKLDTDANNPIAKRTLEQMIDGATRQVMSCDHNLAKDGTPRYCDWYNSVLQDADGKMTSVMSQVMDVTDRICIEKERQKLLGEVQHRVAEFEATFSSMADGVIIYAADGSIERANSVADHLLGQPDQVQLLTMDNRLFPASEHPAQLALHSGITSRGVLMIAEKQQEQQQYWLSVSAAPIQSKAGVVLGAVMNFTDITSLHELEEQQKTLLHLVSHDLRAPLAIIKGYAQIVSSSLNKPEDAELVKDSLLAIQRGVDRMDVMIDDLVEVTCLESGQMRLNKKEICITGYLDSLLSRYTRTMDVSRISIEIAGVLPRVNADPDRLERIFVNLLSNALKYSTPGTIVTVSAQQRTQEVVIAISDIGPGIPEDDIPHLFERFYRASGSRKAEGIGLGLYITNLLVTAHYGCIWVKSKVGEGSTFYFSLPMA